MFQDLSSDQDGRGDEKDVDECSRGSDVHDDCNHSVQGNAINDESYSGSRRHSKQQLQQQTTANDRGNSPVASAAADSTATRCTCQTAWS